MATQRRSGTRRYRTNGNVAYQPEFEHAPLQKPSRREQIRGNTVRRPEPARRPQPRPRRRPAASNSRQPKATSFSSPSRSGRAWSL